MERVISKGGPTDKNKSGESTPEQKRKHQEELIDESLVESFPASDPATPYRVIKRSNPEEKKESQVPGNPR